MPIRIFFLSTGLYIGGEETQNLLTFSRMKDKGFEFILGTTKDAGPFSKPFRDAGFEVFPKLLNRSKFDLSGLMNVRAFIRKVGTDIVCTGGFGDSLFYGRLAARLAGVKSIINTFFHFGRLDRNTARIELLNSFLHPITTYFKTSSMALRQYLIDEMNYPADKIIAIHDGIDSSRFSPQKPEPQTYHELGIPRNKPVVGMVASLYPFKGPDLFIEAAAIVHKQFPDAVFVMVGEGSERGKVENLIEKYDLRKVVIMLGYRTDVPRILPIFDISVLASDTEAFPNTLLEASACGNPLISTAVGGANEIVLDGYNGYLVPPRNPERMADRICRLLGDENLRKEISENSREYLLENFTIERKVEVFSRFFEQVHHGEPIPPGLYN